ncbi:hypothetical protein [Gluconobacter cerinus]|uniref:hypothetical protein n=1 Tax=Gluconobacter cerinus TaxID=38307 RepID=UPI001B8B5FAA|nr:hypothetical protein [Gluconobacter cerinus]MBS1045608.1 hypothetical protein [Gluconobacter cerinus]
MKKDIEYITSYLNDKKGTVEYDLDSNGSIIINNVSNYPEFNSGSLVDFILMGWLYNYEHDYLIKIK